MFQRAPLITNPLSDEAKAEIISTSIYDNDLCLKRCVEAFLKENRIANTYETKKSRTIRLILLSVFALVLFIDIIYKAFYHKSLILLVLAAAAAYVVIHVKNLRITKYLMDEVKKRPDDPMDNILASQISGACRRRFTTLYGIGLVAAVLVGCGFWFSKPHVIYERNDLGGYSIRYYTLALRNEDHIVLPDTHKGLPVTEIRGEAFYNMRFTSIELPSELTQIRGNTFQKCKRLKSIEIPSGVTRIGGHAFDGCIQLSEVSLPDTLTEIGTSAFRGCKALSSIQLPDSVSSLGENVFRDCARLEEANIPKALEKIPNSTFRNCTALESFRIPDGITTIGESAFRGCKNLKEVYVPESVTYVARRAFAECKQLKEIYIPKAATIISGAFEESPTKVYVYWRKEQ